MAAKTWVAEEGEAMRRRREAYVYVLAAGRGPKKIGVADDPAVRALQVAHLFPSQPRVAFKLYRPGDAYQIEAAPGRPESRFSR